MREGREEERHNLCSPKKKKTGIKLMYNSKGTINKVILSVKKKPTADKKKSSDRSVV